MTSFCGRGRILIVDDDIISLCLLENVLGRLRFKQLRKLADPTRILAEFDAFAPDLVITDFDMPGMDGIHFADEVRRLHPAMPVILLSGFALDPDQCPASVDCILKKPIVRSKLRASLARVYGKNGAHRQRPRAG